MITNRITRAAALAAIIAAGAVTSAWAAASDYRFELAGAPAATGGKTLVDVRLVRAADNAPVAGAIIIEARLDMGPDGMPTMRAPARATPPSSEIGVYRITAEPSMPGRWSLSLAAKVQGERDTVRGSVVFAVEP